MTNQVVEWFKKILMRGLINYITLNYRNFYIN